MCVSQGDIYRYFCGLARTSFELSSHESPNNKWKALQSYPWVSKNWTGSTYNDGEQFFLAPGQVYFITRAKKDEPNT